MVFLTPEDSRFPLEGFRSHRGSEPTCAGAGTPWGPWALSHPVLFLQHTWGWVCPFLSDCDMAVLLAAGACVCVHFAGGEWPIPSTAAPRFLPLLFPVPTSSPLPERSHRAGCSEPHGTFHGKGRGRPLIPKKAGNHVIPASLGLQLGSQPVREAPRARRRNMHPGGQSQRQSADHKWCLTHTATLEDGSPCPGQGLGDFSREEELEYFKYSGIPKLLFLPNLT